jgi:hypothetical protein
VIGDKCSPLTFNDLPKNQISRRVSVRLAEKTCRNKVVVVLHKNKSRDSLFSGGEVFEISVPETLRGEKPRLLRRVHEAIRRLHCSHGSEDVYVHWIRRFIFSSGRCHTVRVGKEEVSAFLGHASVSAKSCCRMATQKESRDGAARAPDVGVARAIK